MKKRWLLLLALAVLCMSFFGATACAEEGAYRYRLELTEIRYASYGAGTTMPKPYETWFFMDNGTVYLPTGERCTYSEAVSGEKTVLTLQNGPHGIKTVTLDGGTASAAGKMNGTDVTYVFAVKEPGIFIATVTAEQNWSMLHLDFSAKGGYPAYTYLYSIYFDDGTLYRSGQTGENSVELLPRLTEDSAEFTVTMSARDAQNNMSELSVATVTVKKDADNPDLVIQDGRVTDYTGTDTEVTIPNAFHGQSPVTGIEPGVFAGSGVKKIHLPDNITEVSYNSFGGAELYCNSKSGNSKSATARSVSEAGLSFFDETKDTKGEYALRVVQYNDQEQLALTAYKGTKESVSVPAELGVECVFDSAFADQSTVREIVLPNTVTRLGALIFSGCNALQRVTLPDTITAIDKSAFVNCNAKVYCNPREVNEDGEGNVTYGVTRTAKALYSVRQVFYDTTDAEGAFGLSLEKVDGEDVLALYTFTGSGTSQMTNVDNIPGYVQCISSNAFKDNSGIVKVTIPAGVKKIGARAFLNTGRLQNVIFAGSALTSIGVNAFADCSSLKTLTLPDNITEVGANAFPSDGFTLFCNAKKEILDGNGNPVLDGEGNKTYELTKTAKTLSAMGVQFYDASDVDAAFVLRVMTINNLENQLVLFRYTGSGKTVGNMPTVDYIHSNAFKDNRTVETITVPADVWGIGEGAFANCSALTALTLAGDEVTEIGETAFSGCAAKVFCNPGEKGAPSTTAGTLSELPHSFYDSDDEAGEYALLWVKDGKADKLALYSYTGVGPTVTTLPDGVEMICDKAFQGNSMLQEVTIPESVKKIGALVFSGCGGLKTITLEKSDYAAADIDPSAFFNCAAKIVCAVSSTTAKTVSALPHSFYDADDTKKEYALLYVTQDKKTVLSLLSYEGEETEVTVPAAMGGVKLEAINANAFASFKGSLEKVTIPGSVKTVPAGLFDGFKNLETIRLAEGVTTLEDLAIRNCASLERVYLPKAVEAFGNNFANCPKLADEGVQKRLLLALDLDFAKATAIMPKDAADAADIRAEFVTEGIAELAGDQLIAVGKGVTGATIYTNGKISTCTVRVVSGLKGLTLPKFTLSVEEEAFRGNRAAQYALLPNGVSEIGANAFADDTALLLIRIPGSVTTIRTGALSGSESVIAVVDQGSTAESYCVKNRIAFQYAVPEAEE